MAARKSSSRSRSAGARSGSSTRRKIAHKSTARKRTASSRRSSSRSAASRRSANKSSSLRSTSARKRAGRKSTGRKSAGSSRGRRSNPFNRRYGRKTQQKVGEEMHEFKRGRLRSSSRGMVTRPKKAIDVGHSEARREGDKTPPRGRKAA